MPLKKPMLTLQTEESESEDDDESGDEPTPLNNSANSNGSGGGLRRGMAGLSLSVGDDCGYEEESPPGGKRGRGPKPLKKQDSFEVSNTMTFEMGDLRLKPEGLIGLWRDFRKYWSNWPLAY